MWAYQMMRQVFGFEAVVLTEIIIPSARMAITSQISDPNGQFYDAEGLKEQ